ncbi:hypothetical protein PR002_g25054 [Phytophthora rubi]|uniref:Uncharacterized protein n=2 Tax=Phytophthora rubi TaxID=129364 RepID=A0A6A3IBK4_9STRA|nr:hypothetical protein PR002_g25054 [Phytophthora rubi]
MDEERVLDCNEPGPSHRRSARLTGMLVELEEDDEKYEDETLYTNVLNISRLPSAISV